MSVRNPKYSKLSQLISEAKVKAKEAANNVEDKGTANLDKLVICGLKGIREQNLKLSGIDCYKHWSDAGSFILSGSFGQGDKNTLGVATMRDFLKANGVDCYIHSRMD